MLHVFELTSDLVVLRLAEIFILRVTYLFSHSSSSSLLVFGQKWRKNVE